MIDRTLGQQWDGITAYQIEIENQRHNALRAFGSDTDVIRNSTPALPIVLRLAEVRVRVTAAGQV